MQDYQSDKGSRICYPTSDEIDVLNISMETPNSPRSIIIIDPAVKAGITVVLSAENRGKDASATTPANHPNVMTVSAIGDSDGVCGAIRPQSYTDGR